MYNRYQIQPPQQNESRVNNYYNYPPQGKPKSPFDQFAKPAQPQYWVPNGVGPNQFNGVPKGPSGFPGNPSMQGFNPFPGQQGQPGQPVPQGSKGIMTYFQDKDGQLDLDKMFSTFGQMANTVQQVSPVVKGIGSFMKGFKV